VFIAALLVIVFQAAPLSKPENQRSNEDPASDDENRNRYRCDDNADEQSNSLCPVG